MAATLNYKINFADYFYYDENSPTEERDIMTNRLN